MYGERFQSHQSLYSLYLARGNFEETTDIPYGKALLYKSITGDVGDGIRGVKGVLDKSRDMVERGRAAVGVHNGSRRHPERLGRGDTHRSRQATNRSPSGVRSKLDSETVKYIKEFLALGFGQTQIAKKVGVHPSVINGIARGKIWKHVA